MPGDTERLFVQLEARINDFEKKMVRAEKRGSKTYNSLSKNSRRTTFHMQRDMARSTTSINRQLQTVQRSFASFGRGLAGGLFAGGVAGTVAGIARVAEGVANIGREAERAGVSVEAFQELGFVAEQNRIPIDALTDGLKELNLRADEFIVTGKGPGAEAFQRLGFGAEDLAERLKDPNELFTEIIARMEDLDRAAQIRIADEIFGGTAGERFVELLDEGAGKIREQIRLANDLGLVMDREMIERAEELDRQFNLVAQTVGNALKRAIVDAASALAQFIDGFRAFEAQSNRSLETRLTDLNARIAAGEANAQRKLGDLANVPRNIADATLEGTTQGTLIAGIRNEIAQLQAERREIESILQSRQTPAFTPPEFTPTTPAGSSSGRGGGGGSRRYQIDQTRELISALEHELKLVGKSQRETDVLNAIRRAGANASDEQRQRIEDLINLRHDEIEAIVQQTQAHQANEDAMRYLSESAVSGLLDVVSGAKSAEDAIKQLALSIADAALQATLFGSGPLGGVLGGSTGGGLLGSLFGGFRAHGGPVSAGRTYMVGEQGPELFKPIQSGSIIPNHALSAPNGSTSPISVEVRGVFVDDMGVIKAQIDSSASETITQSRADLQAYATDDRRRQQREARMR